MDLFIVGTAIFTVTVLILELVLIGYRRLNLKERRNVTKRLNQLKNSRRDINQRIVRDQVLSEITWLNHLLKRIPGLLQWQRLIDQADSEHSLGYYLLLSLLMMCVAWMVTMTYFHNALMAATLVPTAGGLPVLNLLRKRRLRIKRFQEQLPEALDLIGRALKAGHAFTSGLKLTADEFDAPLGKEFQRTVDEINFGLSVSEALHHLADRVDCAETRFFVVSVLLQRETGGNLVEILANLSHILRERFKLHGKIRVLSAEGRLSGWVLVAMPLLMLLWLRVAATDYIGILFSDPNGKLALGASGVLMFLGILVIKKIVSIRV
jgi:tight adherence protein B